jgi:hypothetical protein
MNMKNMKLLAFESDEWVAIFDAACRSHPGFDDVWKCCGEPSYPAAPPITRMTASDIQEWVDEWYTDMSERVKKMEEGNG